MYANFLHGNGEIPGAIDCKSTIGPVEQGQWPQSRHARDWEVGRGNTIYEASEQRYATEQNMPTTGGVRGEKAPGRGEHWTNDRDRHAGAVRNVDQFVQGTRSSETGLKTPVLLFAAPCKR
jgi:hypothetical protein